LDFPLLKTILTEPLKLQFRADVFSVFNSTNFNIPNTIRVLRRPFTHSVCHYGHFDNIRQIQFGLKLLW